MSEAESHRGGNQSRSLFSAARSFLSRRKFLATGTAGLAGSSAWALGQGTADEDGHFGFYNVKHFGVRGDGKTDAGQAIQDIIDSASQVTLPETLDLGGASQPGGVGEVHLPPGIYRVTHPIRLRYGMTLSGAGPEATVIFHDNGNHRESKSQYCLLIEGRDGAPIRYVRVKGLTIAGRASGPNKSLSGPGIRITQATNCLVRDIRIRNLNGGIKMGPVAQSNTLSNVSIRIPPFVNGVIEVQGDCLWLDGPGVNRNLITGCRFEPGVSNPDAAKLRPNRGIRIDGPANANSIIGCTFDTGDIGIELNGEEKREAVTATQISGCHFEPPRIPIKAGTGSGVSGLTATGNFFWPNRDDNASLPEEKAVAIQMNLCRGAYIAGNYFHLPGIEPRAIAGAAIQITQWTSQSAFVANVYSHLWAESVRGPLETNEGSENVNHFYTEIMNQPSWVNKPFRIRGREAFLDLPVAARGRGGKVEAPSREFLARLIVEADPETSNKVLYVWLGDKKCQLADEADCS